MAIGKGGAPGRWRNTCASLVASTPTSPYTAGCLPAHLPTAHLPACPQENRLAQHTIQALQSELDSLRADNIKLFEKIKFLQSYPGRVSAFRHSSLRCARQGEGSTRPSRARGLGTVTYQVALGIGSPRGHPAHLAYQRSSLSWGEPPNSRAFMQIHHQKQPGGGEVLQEAGALGPRPRALVTPLRNGTNPLANPRIQEFNCRAVAHTG